MKHIFIDQEKCFGCRTCEIVCSFTKEKEINPTLSRIKINPRPNGKVVCNVCHKCNTPVCVQSCPIDAITIENGQFMLMKPCIENCTSCIEACPYKAIVYIPGKSVDVCDLCGSCIPFCPVNAIHITEGGANV